MSAEYTFHARPIAFETQDVGRRNLPASQSRLHNIRDEAGAESEGWHVVPLDPGSPSFLNVALDTATLPDADTNYPSWGSVLMRQVMRDTLPNTKLGVGP